MMAAGILIPGVPVAILAHLELLEHMSKHGKTQKRMHAHRPAKVAKRAREGAQ